jgi:hypothetical protein
MCRSAEVLDEEEYSGWKEDIIRIIKWAIITIESFTIGFLWTF